MKVADGLVWARRELASAGILEADIEAEVLLRTVLQIDRTALFASLSGPVSDAQMKRFGELVQRRLTREPLAYILGHREFYGLDFIVNQHVLIPRQETELLVDKVLEWAKAYPGEQVTIADICTGSGAIAIAVAVHLPNAVVHATDISLEALAVADQNCRRHGLASRVHLYQGDLLAPLPCPVDIMVANPPYIPTGQICGLAAEVRLEPKTALDGCADGMEIVRRILAEASSHLRPGGRIGLEISPPLLDSVISAAYKAFPESKIGYCKDLSRLPRMISIE